MSHDWHEADHEERESKIIPRGIQPSISKIKHGGKTWKRRQPTRRTVTCSFAIDVDLDNEIEIAKEEDGITRSALARTAFAEYLLRRKLNKELIASQAEPKPKRTPRKKKR